MWLTNCALDCGYVTAPGDDDTQLAEIQHHEWAEHGFINPTD